MKSCHWDTVRITVNLCRKSIVISPIKPLDRQSSGGEIRRFNAPVTSMWSPSSPSYCSSQKTADRYKQGRFLRDKSVSYISICVIISYHSCEAKWHRIVSLKFVDVGPGNDLPDGTKPLHKSFYWLIIQGVPWLLPNLYFQVNQYSDVLISAMASQIISLTSVNSTICSGADQRKQNIKALRHWPLWGEFIGGRWIPRTTGQ